MKTLLRTLGLIGLFTLGYVNEAEAKAPKKTSHSSKQKRHSTPSKTQLENIVAQGSAKFYFPTNSWMIHGEDIKDLRKFYNLNKTAPSVIVEGHADARGPDDLNFELGENRAKGIEHYLRGFGYTGNIIVTSFGEAKPVTQGEDKAALQRNRRVEILVSDDALSRALELSKADIYLIDATGSMIQKGKWKAVTDFKYPAESKFFGFNSCTGTGNYLKQVNSLKEINPTCETPLWEALYNLIERTESGKTITVLTDGENNHGMRNSTDVINLAKSRGVRIQTIAVSVNDQTTNFLGNIAAQTGGSGYKIN